MPSDRELKVLSLVCYLTDAEAWQNARPDDYTANKMVKALKGDPINGYFARKYGTFNNDNKHVFAEQHVPQFLVDALRIHVKIKATIVPIPNSHVLNVGDPNFKTYDLASRVAAASGGQFTASPLLVFRRQQVKSREGGPRHASSIEKEYVVTGSTNRPIILLDDVLTTGGHMIAACRVLEAGSSLPILGIAFGHAVKEQRPEPIGLQETTLWIDPITSL